jgi:hypothetical protein
VAVVAVSPEAVVSPDALAAADSDARSPWCRRHVRAAGEVERQHFEELRHARIA